MNALESLVMSGRIVDLIVLFFILEAGVLLYVWRARGSGIPPLSLLANLGAGASIMLALRAALTAAGWAWVASFLLCALVFHIADFGVRWKSVSE